MYNPSRSSRFRHRSSSNFYGNSNLNRNHNTRRTDLYRQPFSYNSGGYNNGIWKPGQLPNSPFRGSSRLYRRNNYGQSLRQRGQQRVLPIAGSFRRNPTYSIYSSQVKYRPLPPKMTARKPPMQGNSWGPWGTWSKCSRSCNGGARTRTRACIRYDMK